jgi:4-amino-4-deoxy-L-arabinose transferase-like glycosyltransferase
MPPGGAAVRGTRRVPPAGDVAPGDPGVRGPPAHSPALDVHRRAGRQAVRMRDRDPGVASHRVVATALVLLALALRLHHLGREEAWLDEAFSYHDVARAGWAAGLREAHVPPLYPLVLRAGLGVAGRHDEAALRAPSAVLGAATAGATVWTAGLLFGWPAAAWAGLVAAASPLAVYYGQEARGYALLVFLVTLAAGLVVRATARGRGAWAAVAVAATGVLYTHYLGVIALVPLVAVAWSLGGRRAAGRTVLAGAAAVALFLPWLVWTFVLAPHDMHGVDWVAAAWAATPPVLAVPKSLYVFHLGSEAGLLPVAMKQLGTIAFPPALRALGAVGLIAVLVFAGAGGRGAGRRRAAAAAWALLALPLAALLAISAVKPVYLVGRYDLLAFPGFALVAGLGLAQAWSARRRLAGAAAVAAFVVPLGAKLVLYFTQPPVNAARSRAAARALVAAVGDDEAVIFTDYRGYPLLYQLSLLGVASDEGTRCTGRLRFTCAHFPPAGIAAPTDADVVRAVDGYLGGGAVDRVSIVFGTWDVAGGGFNVPADDRRLVGEVMRRGFVPQAVDPALGVVRYARPRR